SSSGFFDSDSNLNRDIKTGNAGDIFIKGDTLHLFGNANIGSRAFSANVNAGAGGDVQIDANQVLLEEGSRIQVKTFGPGAGGKITINATNSQETGLVELLGLQFPTFLDADTAGEGNGGNISINSDTIRIRGGGPDFVGISAQVDIPNSDVEFGTFGGSPNGGNIDLFAKKLEVLDGGQVSTGIRRGMGQGGLLNVSADNTFISGVNTAEYVSGIFSSSEQPRSIPPNFSNTISQTHKGTGGDIFISSKTLELTNKGEINTATNSQGKGGKITLNTETLKLNNTARISAESSSTSSHADSGSISINSLDSVTMQNSSSITAGSLRQLLRFDNIPEIKPVGDAGQITITTPILTIENSGTTISTLTEGAGKAGEISLNINNLLASIGTKISSESAGPGKAGNITISGKNNGIASTVNLVNTDITTISNQTGPGGDISISTQNLNLNNSQILATANEGIGGNVIAKVGVAEITNNAKIKAGSIGTSSTAKGGTITISGLNGPDTRATSLRLSGASPAGSSPTNPFEGTQISTFTTSDQDPGTIKILGDTVTMQGGLIGSPSFTEAASGEIIIKVGNLEMSEGGQVNNSTFGSGKGGTVNVQADKSVTIQGHETGFISLVEGSNDGGEIQISSNDIFLSQNAEISTDSSGKGNAGRIRLSAKELLSVKDSTITSESTSGSNNAGDAGSILLESIDNSNSEIILDHAHLGTTINGGDESSQSGDITLSSVKITLQNDSNIESDTTGRAVGGTIILNADYLFSNFSEIRSRSVGDAKGNAGRITLRGLDGKNLSSDDLSEPATEMNLKNSAVSTRVGIQRGAFSEGRGGAIGLSGQLIALEETTLDSSTLGSGDAGDIIIRPVDLTAKNSTIKSASEAEGGNAGASGSLSIGEISFNSNRDISTNRILLENTVLATTIEGGRRDVFPGNITLTGENLLLKNDTTVTANTRGTAPAGHIVFNVGQMTSKGSGDTRPTISSTGVIGNAGTIEIQGIQSVGTSNMGPVTLSQTDITTTALGSEEGGSITISSAAPISLTDTILSANVNDKGNTSGSIADLTLTTPSLTLIDSQLTAQTTGNRNAGNITLNVHALTATGLTARNLISSSSTGQNTPAGSSDGNAGRIVIQRTSDTATPVAGTIALGQTDIATEALGNGAGGPITISSTTPITLTDTVLSANVNNIGSTSSSGSDLTLITPDLHITGGGITAQTTGSRDAGNLILNVDALTTAAGTTPIPVGGQITDLVQLSSSSGSGSGDAGNIFLNTSSSGIIPTTLKLQGTEVTTAAGGIGQGGEIFLRAQTISFDKSMVSATATEGSGGNIQIELESGQILNGASIEAGSNGVSSNAVGGTITIQGLGGPGTRANSLGLSGGSSGAPFIPSRISTFTKSDQDPGAINIFVDQLTMNKGLIGSPSTTSASSGQISLNVENLTMFGGARVDNSSFGAGQGGAVTVIADNMVNISGQDTGFFSTANGSGKGGGISITSNVFSLQENARITADSSAEGNAGSIFINAKEGITLNHSEISAKATGSGDAGDVEVKSEAFIQSTDSLLSSSANSGEGGIVELLTTSNMVLDSTTIATEVSNGSGNSGNIKVKAGTVNSGDISFGNEQLLIRNNSVLSAKSLGQGDAGDITVESVGTLRIRDSQITTEAPLEGSTASGGNIKLTSDLLVHLMDSQLQSSVQGTEGAAGGDISIDPEFVIIQNSQILARAVAGTGGNINIAGGLVLTDALSTIDASSQFG
ncbi:MAG: hypothetical protein KC643_32225, partial [Nitrospira sp.]|nr:hypothetical protein [Nitrospira sp.]